MPTVSSKPIINNQQMWKQMLKGAWQSMLKDKSRQVIVASAIGVIFFLLYQRKRTRRENDRNKKEVHIDHEKKQKGRGNVDRLFFKRISKLVQIVIPNIKSSAVFDIILLTLFLIARTYLSIWIAGANGRIVKSIIKLNFEMFIKRIFQLAMVAVPASFVNSYLDYLNRSLAITFRKNLTNHFSNIYLKNMIFYQLTNLDSRVSNPDQRLTSDIEKWANSLSQIYSNFSKPMLDIVLFSRKLSELVGWIGPMVVFSWYMFSGLLIKYLSPPFGKMAAQEQRLEGVYRATHTDLVHHAEEVAFYQGNKFEQEKINVAFRNLMNHSTQIMNKRLFMGTFDSLLTKYGAVLVGYAILGLPVFGPGSEEYIKSIANDPSAITRDYIRNSSLLINLAKAIGRLVISYKEIQQLAGYTSLVDEMGIVLADLEQGQYDRQLVEGADNQIKKNDRGLVDLNYKNVKTVENYIKFDKVPIITPNGDKLVRELDITIASGQHYFVSGPNGCGKSSLFRVLGGLWPIFGGVISRPEPGKLFYIPQRPYLPAGSLRDQIIYPHLYDSLEYKRKKVTDEYLKELLDVVKLGYVVEREQKGFDAVDDWNDKLSGGEKQRIAMARLFYHQPLFAILDECTAAVALDVEKELYAYAKRKGITLFTISHKLTALEYHDYMLKFDNKEWQLIKLDKQVVQEQKFV